MTNSLRASCILTPSPHAARHQHPGRRRRSQARTSPASYLPWLSTRPCWPRCFPAPLTVGGQLRSRSAGLSAPGGCCRCCCRCSGCCRYCRSREPGARLSYRIIPALIPRSFPALQEEPPPPLLPPSVSPLPPSLNSLPPTPHPPRFSVTPFSSPPTPSDALMPRMPLPPLRPSRGCGTSRLGQPNCAGARPGRASCLGARGEGPAGTCSFLGAPRWALAGGAGVGSPAPGPAPRVKAGVVQAHEGRWPMWGSGRMKGGPAELGGAPQSRGPDLDAHALRSGLVSFTPC